MPSAIPTLFMGLNLISGVRSLFPPPAPRVPPPLTFEQAREEARRVLEPLYGEHLERALREIDRANIRRGFFGQLPGAALARATAADIQTRQAQAIGELAGQLQGLSAQQAAQQAQLALQAHRQNLLAEQERLANLGTALQNFGQMFQMWPGHWSRWFGGGPDPSQVLASMSGVAAQGWGTTPMPTSVPANPGLTTFSRVW